MGNLILLIVLILLLCGTFPRWKYSRNWGYAPVSVLTIVLGIVLILLLVGNLPWREWPEA